MPLKASCTHITSISISRPNCSYKGNNVCQERVKLEPKPTLLPKSTPKVPTSLLIAELTASNTNKSANSIRIRLLSASKKRLCAKIPSQLHRTLHHEEVAFIRRPLSIRGETRR